MLRALFALRSSWWRACLAFAGPTAGLLMLSAALLWIGLHVRGMGAVSALTIGLLLSRRRPAQWPRWLWPLSNCARRFSRAVGPRITLYVDPRCQDHVKTPEILQMCRRHIDELAGWFGFKLRRRVLVFLHADSREIGQMIGASCGGFAVHESNAVVVYAGGRLEESIRHEIAHLFAARWNRRALWLLNEGLATWLQGRVGGAPLDVIERELLERRSPEVADLLSWHRFLFSEDRTTNYHVAASFTGFLLQRFGRERYRQFFRIPSARLAEEGRFRAAFEKCFGLPLAEASYQWRVNVLVLHVLKRKLERELRQGHFRA